ncbi:MAG: hypothetical protein GY866_13810 [Proteobacteria bacterium]|nr:hypothetical protein [Pseudomonadota bacterium]
MENNAEFKIIELVIRDFKGIEVFEHKLNDAVPTRVCGDHGSGKTNVIEALMVLFHGAAAFKKIDDPVRHGAKKLTISATLQGTGNILQEFDLGDSLRLTLTKTSTGDPNIRIEDLDSGKVIRSNGRTIVDKLRSHFLDPMQFLKLLDNTHGAREQAEFVAGARGLDFTPFVEKEEKLFDQYKMENGQVSRLKKLLESLDEPEEDWATVFTDPSEISAEKDKLAELKRVNEAMQQQVVAAESEVRKSVDHAVDRLRLVRSEKKTAVFKRISFEDHTKDLNEYVAQNPLEEWEGDSEEEIERRIAELQAQLKAKRELDDRNKIKKDAIAEKRNKLPVLELEMKTAYRNFDDAKDGFGNARRNVSALRKNRQFVAEINQPNKWTGTVDPEGRYLPAEYLTKLMNEVNKLNEEVRKRREFKEATENVQLAEKARDKIQEARNRNAADKASYVDTIGTGVEGLLIDENKLYVKKGYSEPVTFNDLNHADQVRVATEILIANNKGPLKLIAVREAYACLPEYQRILCDVARENGYSIILETFVAEGDGVVWMKEGHIVDGPDQKVVKQIGADVPVENIVSEATEQTQNEMNWG